MPGPLWSPTPPRRRTLYGDLRNRHFRISRQLRGGRVAYRAPRQAESSGARKERAGGARALVGFAAAAFCLPGILRLRADPRTHIFRGLDTRTVRTSGRRVPRVGG